MLSNSNVLPYPSRSPQVREISTSRSFKTSFTSWSTSSVTITGMLKYDAIGVAATPK